MTDKERLNSAIIEAQTLLARNEGCHNMHGHYYGIKAWMRKVNDDIPMEQKNWDNVELLLGQMRIYDETKIWPR